MRTPVDIHWLRVNAQPVKIQLSQYVARWEERYSQFLSSFVYDRIQNLIGFIKRVQSGLSDQSPADQEDGEGDSQQNNQLLYATMSHIRDVKYLQTALRSLFDPIRNGCSLLRKIGCPVEDELLQELETGPARWDETIRSAFDERERILPLQNVEMLKIRHKIDSFASDVQTFRTEFRENCPFSAEG